MRGSDDASVSVVNITPDVTCVLGEGPIYDERTDTLYFVDINTGLVMAIADVSAVVQAGSEEGRVKLVFTSRPSPASCMFLTSDPSKIVVGTNRDLILVDMNDTEPAPGEPVRMVAFPPGKEAFARVDGSSRVLATLPDTIGATDEDARFNDGKATPDGTALVVGHLSLSWRTGPMGGLAAFDASTKTFRDITPPQGIGCPNGIVWRNGKFLIVDSRDESIRSYAANEHGVPDTDTNDVVSQTATGHANVPDGMALDADGNLWVAVAETGSVRCLDGERGNVLREVRLPVKRPTSCNFGA